MRWADWTYWTAADAAGLEILNWVRNNEAVLWGARPRVVGMNFHVIRREVVRQDVHQGRHPEGQSGRDRPNGQRCGPWAAHPS